MHKQKGRDSYASRFAVGARLALLLTAVLVACVAGEGDSPPRSWDLSASCDAQEEVQVGRLGGAVLIWGGNAGVSCLGNAYTGMTRIDRVSYRIRLVDFQFAPTSLEARVYDLADNSIVATAALDPEDLPSKPGEWSRVTATFSMNKTLDPSGEYWVAFCNNDPPTRGTRMYDMQGELAFQYDWVQPPIDYVAHVCSDPACSDLRLYDPSFTAISWVDFSCEGAPSPSPSFRKKRHLCKCRPSLGSL